MFSILKKWGEIINKSLIFNLTPYLPCLSVLATLTHVSMKRVIWPFYYVFHISVLHRVVVDIGHVYFIIPLIPDLVFPEVSLPESGFFSSAF